MLEGRILPTMSCCSSERHAPRTWLLHGKRSAFQLPMEPQGAPGSPRGEKLLRNFLELRGDHREPQGARGSTPWKILTFDGRCVSRSASLESHRTINVKTHHGKSLLSMVVARRSPREPQGGRTFEELLGAAREPQGVPGGNNF